VVSNCPLVPKSVFRPVYKLKAIAARVYAGLRIDFGHQLGGFAPKFAEPESAVPELGATRHSSFSSYAMPSNGLGMRQRYLSLFSTFSLGPW